MLVPGLAVMPMVLGGVVQWMWAQGAPEERGRLSLPLSSGFIAGEALLVLVFAILAMFAGSGGARGRNGRDPWPRRKGRVRITGPAGVAKIREAARRVLPTRPTP